MSSQTNRAAVDAFRGACRGFPGIIHHGGTLREYKSKIRIAMLAVVSITSLRASRGGSLVGSNPTDVVAMTSWPSGYGA